MQSRQLSLKLRGVEMVMLGSQKEPLKGANISYFILTIQYVLHQLARLSWIFLLTSLEYFQVCAFC